MVTEFIFKKFYSTWLLEEILNTTKIKLTPHYLKIYKTPVAKKCWKWHEELQ